MLSVLALDYNIFDQILTHFFQTTLQGYKKALKSQCFSADDFKGKFILQNLSLDLEHQNYLTFTHKYYLTMKKGRVFQKEKNIFLSK